MKTFATLALRSKLLLPGAFALALAACQAEEPTYEADAEDLSGGELVVSPEDPDAVAVDLPETPMTPAPEEAMAGDGAAEDAAE